MTDLTTLQLHGSLVETLTDLEPEIRLAVMGRKGELHGTANHAIGSHLDMLFGLCIALFWSLCRSSMCRPAS